MWTGGDVVRPHVQNLIVYILSANFFCFIYSSFVVLNLKQTWAAWLGLADVFVMELNAKLHNDVYVSVGEE